MTEDGLHPCPSCGGVDVHYAECHVDWWAEALAPGGVYADPDE